MRLGIQNTIAAVFVVFSFQSQATAQLSTTVYGPEVLKASLKGSEYNKTFKAKSNTDAVLTLVNGDGSDLSQVKCTGSVVQRLACTIKNIVRLAEVVLLRSQSVEILVNNKKVVSSTNYKPELGSLQVSLKTLTGQPVAAVINQIKISVKGSPLAQIRLDVKAQTGAVNQLPMAQFSFNPNNSLAPALVSFSGFQSSDPDGQIASYSWNFGDGGSGTGSLVTHSFATAGIYNVRLTVTDNLGGTGTIVQVVTVISDNTPPTLSSVNQRFVITSLPGILSINLTASEILSSATVDGRTLVVNGNQASGDVSVAQGGQLVLPIVLRDLAGNTFAQTRTFNVIVDQNVPIIVAVVAESIYTNQNRISIPISVTDESEVMTTLTLNGLQILSTQNKQFTYEVNLPTDGEYRLVIAGVDEAGRSAISKAIIIRRDTVAPVISNIQPTNELPVNSRLVVVTGSVSENANITVNGVAASVAMGSFTAIVRATRDGAFPILIQATDAANNLTSSTINIMIDTGSDRLWTYEECSIEGGL